MPENNLKAILILLGLSCVFFMLGNGILSLTNPDEVFYAQVAKEMTWHHTWLVPYLFNTPQFEKPIFLYWLLRSAFFLFGVSSFSARFFPALFASLGVLATYFLGRLAFKNERKAFLCSLILMSCGLYIGLARTLFTDMIFSVFILFSLTSFYWGYCRQERKGSGIILFFIFSALAVLTKGPLGVLVPALVVGVFLFFRKDIRFLLSRYSLWGIFIFVGISFPWYIFMFRKYSWSFTHEFFYNDHFRRLIEAEHAGNDTWYFYPLSMFAGIFPWSLYLFGALVYLFRHFRQNLNQANIFLLSWVAVVFLIFQPAHSKLVSYIFPCFPALALLTGDFVYQRTLAVNKRRIIFILSGIVPAMLSVAFLLHKNIEPYVSSKLACEYLLNNYPVSNSILCSKPFVRGVRYYTDKEVAVVDTPGENFFSPHPIPFLNTEEKVWEFLRQQRITYCLLKKSQAEDIRRIAGKELKTVFLKAIGNVVILRVEPRA